MSSLPADPVKRQVAAHWDRRAAHFDEDFGHSIRTPAERAAWARLFGLVLPPGRILDVLDAGCGEGYYLRRLRARMGGQRPGGRPCCAAPTSPSPLSGWLPDAILRVCMQWPVPITCRYCLTELMYSSPTSLR